jgi:hypothetical protein
MSRLKYFDQLFTTGPLVRNVAVKYAKNNNIQVDTLDDYFRLVLEIVDVDPDNIDMDEFAQEMWSLVVFNQNVLRVGQIVRLVNKRFTGNLYRILALHNRGFDVENIRLPKYKFYDLDYNSIDKIIRF